MVSTSSSAHSDGNPMPTLLRAVAAICSAQPPIPAMRAGRPLRRRLARIPEAGD